MVAPELVGTVLVAAGPAGETAGRIVEVEAYLGPGDAASHAARGPTRRSAIMFGPPGIAYVYFIYGMHHCLNVVTEPAGRAGAVLIRALEPLAGLDLMARRRAGARGRLPPVERLCAGPGVVCRSLGIDLSWNGAPLRGPRLRLLAGSGPPPRLAATTRIGVRAAAASRYRFVDRDSPSLSVPLPRDTPTAARRI